MKYSYGKRLKKYRKYKKLTQEELAEILGITAVSLWRIESGVTAPSANTIAQLIEKTDISPEWLLTGKGNMIKDTKILERIEREKKKLDALEARYQGLLAKLQELEEAEREAKIKAIIALLSS